MLKSPWKNESGLHPKEFVYLLPQSINEASTFLAKYKDESKVLAGGQSLLPLMKLRLASPQYIVDIGRIEGLSYIKKVGKQIRIGALTRYKEIGLSRLLQQLCPILPETVSVIGDPQVRNRGTIGGNITHADPANDIPPTMLALNAEFVLKSKAKTRKVIAGSFFKDLFQTALRYNEILSEVRITLPPPRSGGAYLKFERKEGDFAVASVASQLTIDAKGNCSRIGIGLGGVGETSIKARESEECLLGSPITDELIRQAASKASEICQPAADIRGSSEFKKHLIRVLAERSLRLSFSRATGGVPV